MHRHMTRGVDNVDSVDNGSDGGPHALTVDNDELDVIKEAQGVAEFIDFSA
jgi:hypothetical protein